MQAAGTTVHVYYDSLWEMIERSAVQMLPLTAADAPRMRKLMRKYADRPMDLADAARVVVAERENILRIFTIDKADSESTVFTGGDLRSFPDQAARITRQGH